MTKFDDSTVTQFEDYVNRLLKLKTLSNALKEDIVVINKADLVVPAQYSLVLEESTAVIDKHLNAALIVCDDMGFEIVEGLAE